MKSHKVFKGSIVLGALLFIVGFFFAQRDWIDIFHGLYSGPVLIILGIVLQLFTENKEVMNTNQNLLSSRATFLYKFVFPFITGVALTVYFLFPEPFKKMFMGGYIMIGASLFFLCTMVFIIGVLINYVYYNSEAFFIKNKNVVIPIEEVESINRFFYNYYAINCRNGKKYFLLPHILEVFENLFNHKPFVDPKSIKRAKRLIADNRYKV
ncbi:MAG: hypothetical protein LPJ89_06480 [Hymenobacteraceae bacterium]|nr:hypothetical protein [Hymenobacteraceae bacterium]